MISTGSAAVDDLAMHAAQREPARVGPRRICVVQVGDPAEGLSPRSACIGSDDHAVTAVHAGRFAAAETSAADPDLVVVVVGDAPLDLVGVCAALRAAIGCRIVIVVESGCSVDEDTVIAALDAGADDFVDADVGENVLLARIRVALRATPVRPRLPDQIVVGDVLIDLEAHAVLVGGEPVSCPPLQFDVLVALASAPGAVVLRDTLMVEVWGLHPGTVDPHRVRIAISMLRRMIGSGPRRPVIESVSRIGYRLVGPPAAV